MSQSDEVQSSEDNDRYRSALNSPRNANFALDDLSFTRRTLLQLGNDIFSSEESVESPSNAVSTTNRLPDPVDVSDCPSQVRDNHSSNVVASTDIFGEMSMSDIDEDDNEEALSNNEQELDTNIAVEQQQYIENVDNANNPPLAPTFQDCEETVELDSHASPLPIESEKEEETQIVQVKIPRIKLDLGNEMHFVKVPHFLNIEHKPFEANTYQEENGMADDIDELERKRLKLRLENTIRWRTITSDENGIQPLRQSNTRFVQWSDGSLSLFVGNKIFDVFKNNISSDNNYLFVRHGSYLHGQGPFVTKLTFKQFSSDSNAGSRLVSAPLSRKSVQSQQKIRILSTTGQNPDLNRIELIKQEEKRMKKEERRRNLLERRKEEARYAKRRQINSRYLERNCWESDTDKDSNDQASDGDNGSETRNRRGTSTQVKRGQVNDTSSADESDDVATVNSRYSDTVERTPDLKRLHNPTLSTRLDEKSDEEIDNKQQSEIRHSLRVVNSSSDDSSI